MAKKKVKKEIKTPYEETVHVIAESQNLAFGEMSEKINKINQRIDKIIANYEKCKSLKGI